MVATKCKECGGVVSSRADACPHCGASTPIKRTVTALAVMFLLGLLAMVWMVTSSCVDGCSRIVFGP